MTIHEYLKDLINDIPYEVYILAFVTFCAGAAMFLDIKGWRKGIHYSLLLLLVEYIILIYCSTVFFRDIREEHAYNFTPFWSYREIAKNNTSILLAENIMNIVVFVPIGILSAAIIRKHRFIKTMVLGVGISMSIETLQLILKRGLPEFDDVFHNTLGCAIGLGIYSILKYGYVKFTKRSMASN